MKITTLRQRQFLTGLLLVLVFSAGFVAGNLQPLIQAQTLSGDVLPPANADQTFAAFWQVYNLIQKNYVEVPDQEVLVNGAIKGLVDALDDQYSGYIEPDFFEFYSDNLSGSIEGIGVVISEVEGTGEIEVVNVMEGTPAQRVGIREGDIFVSVNGEAVAGFTYLELASRVRGQAGTTVDLIMRRGNEEISLTVERARIEIPNTEVEIFDGGIGYIKLNQFTAEARRQLDDRLEEIDAENLNGVILDLRGNPGGYLGSAIEIASAFIEDGVILYERFGDGTEQTFETDGSYLGLDTPLVVLIDERSASASELVSGAWQDNGVATIIGVTSFGKGTVQTQNDLVNGGGIRLTIARWLTPDKNWIHGEGITPDIIVEWDVESRIANPDDDPQLEAAIEFLMQPETEASK